MNTNLIIEIHNYLENINGPINTMKSCIEKNSFMNIAFGNPYAIQFGTVFSFKKSDIDNMFKNASNNDKIQLAEILDKNYDINNKTKYPIEIEYSELIKLPQLIVNDKKMDGSCMMDCLQVLSNKITEKKISRSKLSTSINYTCFGFGFLSTASTVAGFAIPQFWGLKALGLGLGVFFTILTVGTRVKNMFDELERQNNSKDIKNLTESAGKVRNSVENMAINNNKQQNNSKETKTTNEKKTKEQQEEKNESKNNENLIKTNNENKNINPNNKQIVSPKKDEEANKETKKIVPVLDNNKKNDEKKLEEYSNLMKVKQQLKNQLKQKKEAENLKSKQKDNLNKLQQKTEQNNDKSFTKKEENEDKNIISEASSENRKADTSNEEIKKEEEDKKEENKKENTVKKNKQTNKLDDKEKIINLKSINNDKTLSF